MLPTRTRTDLQQQPDEILRHLDSQFRESQSLDLQKYPLSHAEQIRIADLMRLVAEEGGATALDAGALWGYNSELLSQWFQRVTALDLEKPQWTLPRVTTVAGDITRLQFPDNSFDCVLCSEVLEHIPDVQKAASELARVTRRRLVIGVPFEQDIRLGRVTCTHCGKANPPYGHVHSFNEETLKGLFPGLKVEAISFVLPMKKERTSSVAAWLMDRAGNPYGDYARLERCIYCDRTVEQPECALPQRMCMFIANRLNALRNLSAPIRPAWIHIVFRKTSPTPSFFLLHKVRSAVRKRGVVGAVRTATEYAFAPLQRYSPRRLAKRCTDWGFDRRHGVDTGTGVDLDRLCIAGENVALGRRYQASSEKIFREALDSLPINHQDFAFVDFGSGKGKCLLMASNYPFRRIVGVEFSEELVAVAERNIERYRSPRQQCRNLEPVACDAATFQLPDDPGIYYFYNPFQVAIMRLVRDHIRSSLERHPRPTYIVYYNALHREVFDEALWLRLVRETADYCIYAAKE